MHKTIINDKSIFFSGLAYFVIMLSFIAMRLIVGAGLLGDVNNNLTDYIFTFLVQIVILLGIPILFMKTCAKQKIGDIFKRHSFRPINVKMVLLSILLGVCTYILITYVSTFWHGILTIFGYSGGVSQTTSATNIPWLDLVLGLVFVGVLPGFCEEFSHRGMVLGNIKKDGTMRALLLSSLLFGLMHLSIAQVGYAFVVGLVLGSITLLTRSIYPAMIVHCVSNSVNTYLSYAGENGWWGGDFFSYINNFVLNNNAIFVYFVNTVILMLLLLLMAHIMLNLFKQAKLNDFYVFKRKLVHSLKDGDYSDQIDVNDDKQIYLLYRETQLRNVHQKLENTSLTPEQIEQNINKSSLLSIMFDEDVTKKQKIKYLDYIFYYCSIILGTIITIITFIWGVI